MNWTKENLKIVHDHAKDLMTWREIAYLMDIDVDEFKNDFFNHKSDLYITYCKGVAERKKALRLPVLKMAENGSPQAEIIADKLMREQKISELDE